MKILLKSGLAVFLLNILTGCAHKTFPVGNYQTTPVIADGNLNEWVTPLRFASNGGQVSYNVTNDKENIYISLQTHDGATAIKILRAGVIIYIDPSAGQSKKTALSFPLPTSAPILAKNTSFNGQEPKVNEIREGLLLQANIFSTAGFINMENKVYDVSDKSKIKVGILSGANNGLGYEATIPLKYIFEVNNIVREALQNITVGIVINAIKVKPKNRSNNASNDNFAGSNSGGMRGGGRGRSMGGMSSGNDRGNSNMDKNNPQIPGGAALFKQDANWYTFKLAGKN